MGTVPLLVSLVLVAHPGELDQYGGHHGPKGYHCHACPCGCTEVLRPEKKDRKDKDGKDSASGETKKDNAKATAAEETPPEPPPSPYAERLGDVRDVTQRGVLILDGGERVYLAGIEFPPPRSRVPPVREAAQKARMEIRKLAVGKKVVLQFEKGRAPRPDLPRNAAEAHVQVKIPLRVKSLDGRVKKTKDIPTDLGEHLLLQGLAKVRDDSHFLKKEAYYAAQQRARQAKRGMWTYGQGP